VAVTGKMCREGKPGESVRHERERLAGQHERDDRGERAALAEAARHDEARDGVRFGAWRKGGGAPRGDALPRPGDRHPHRPEPRQGYGHHGKGQRAPDQRRLGESGTEPGSAPEPDDEEERDAEKQRRAREKRRPDDGRDDTRTLLRHGFLPSPLYVPRTIATISTTTKPVSMKQEVAPLGGPATPPRERPGPAQRLLHREAQRSSSERHPSSYMPTHTLIFMA
jgi:hypothetical protein